MQSPWPILFAPFVLAAALCWTQNPAEEGPKPVRERNWNQILGPSQARWPSPRPTLTWFGNLEQAQATAAREGRPLFVVLRCLPCKQCADFDAAVLEGGPVLTPLLQQFVTVRLTNVQPLDLRQFPMQSMQDLDLSWWGWFFSPQGSIYGVFGGKDEHGDSSRISVSALATTLKRVLDHHFDPRHADWEVDVKPLRGGKPVTALDLPGFASWGRRFVQDNPIECIHCHQVSEILRQPAIDAKTFDKQRDLQIWPYPENIGIQVLRDDGLLVAKVSEGSPAAAAGL
ncbi:MAG: thioredoxin family protein, partial [Planctomycetota bacterium]